MRSTRLLALAVAAAFAVAGCTTSGSGETGDGPPEVAATVDGVEILSARIQEIVEAQAALLEDVEESGLPDARKDQERNALSAEIQLQAVEAAVEERFGLDISEEAVDEALAASIEAQGGQEAFDQLADEQGLTSEEAMGFAREQAYVQVLVEYVQGKLAEEGGITEEELRAQYEADPQQFQSATVSHILVETEEEAQAALDRLEAGEDFAALAQELSQDPGSAQNGGSLGEQARGSYVEPFSEAVYSEDTAIGEVVGPVETEFGFHLIRVDDRSTPTFEEVRPQLEAQLSGAAFGDFLDSVFEDMEVEVADYYGTWSAEQRMVVAATPEADGTEAPDAGTEAPDAGTEAPDAGTEAPDAGTDAATEGDGEG